MSRWLRALYDFLLTLDLFFFLYSVWARVTEDYAPWDIDVTTEAPPLPWSDKVLQVLITDYVDANGRYLPVGSSLGRDRERWLCQVFDHFWLTLPPCK